MDASYARQTDLDKLVGQIDRLVEIINHLVTSKALHEMTQNSISDRLIKIEIDIGKYQEEIKKRLKELEDIATKQKIFRRIVYAQGTILIALSSIHWKTIGNIIIQLFN